MAMNQEIIASFIEAHFTYYKTPQFNKYIYFLIRILDIPVLDNRENFLFTQICCQQNEILNLNIV